MEKETRLILEGLQFLLSMVQPKSERNKDKLSSLMVDIHLKLNPIEFNPSIQDRTNDALKKENNYKLIRGKGSASLIHKSRLKGCVIKDNHAHHTNCPLKSEAENK